jgi:hypothetical protein
VRHCSPRLRWPQVGAIRASQTDPARSLHGPPVPPTDVPGSVTNRDFALPKLPRQPVLWHGCYFAQFLKELSPIDQALEPVVGSQKREEVTPRLGGLMYFLFGRP